MSTQATRILRTSTSPRSSKKADWRHQCLELNRTLHPKCSIVQLICASATRIRLIGGLWVMLCSYNNLLNTIKKVLTSTLKARISNKRKHQEERLLAISATCQPLSYIKKKTIKLFSYIHKSYSRILSVFCLIAPTLYH